jgi:hypothetical protein
MFLFRIEHKKHPTYWVHDPKSSAPAALHPRPSRRALMAGWAHSRLAEDQRREVDLRAKPPRAFFPMELVLTVYPSRN